MASEEHLNIIKQGVEVWEQWRQDNPDVTPDLTGAHLVEANLVRTNFQNATITGIYLYGTARDDGVIDGIHCDYVFWDYIFYFDEEAEKEKTQWEADHRIPKDRDFRPGEFEELYKQ